MARGNCPENIDAPLANHSLLSDLSVYRKVMPSPSVHRCSQSVSEAHPILASKAKQKSTPKQKQSTAQHRQHPHRNRNTLELAQKHLGERFFMQQGTPKTKDFSSAPPFNNRKYRVLKAAEPVVHDPITSPGRLSVRGSSSHTKARRGVGL